MKCKEVTDGEFELIRREAGLLIALFYSNNEELGLKWIKGSLEMISLRIEKKFNTRVCMVNLEKFKVLAKDLRIDPDELPKIVVFVDREQKFGFSANDSEGEPLDFDDILRKITKQLKKFGRASNPHQTPGVSSV